MAMKPATTPRTASTLALRLEPALASMGVSVGAAVGPGNVPTSVVVRERVVGGIAVVNVPEAVGPAVGPAVLAVELRLPLPPETFKIPPLTPPSGNVLLVAFFARLMNASSVRFPVWGALMEPTMPLWQWSPAVCEQ